MPRVHHCDSILVVWTYVFKTSADGICEKGWHDRNKWTLPLMAGSLRKSDNKEILPFKEEPWHAFSHGLLETCLSTCLRMSLQMLRKGREGIRGRQTKQIDAPSFIGSQIISEMFILIFMTLHVLTLFTFPICVATILTHLSFVPVKWNSSLFPTHAICFPP